MTTRLSIEKSGAPADDLCLWLLNSSAIIAEQPSVGQLLDAIIDALEAIGVAAIQIERDRTDTLPPNFTAPLFWYPAENGTSRRGLCIQRAHSDEAVIALRELLRVAEATLQQLPPESVECDRNETPTTRDHRMLNALNDVIIAANSGHTPQQVYVAIRQVIARHVPADVMLLSASPDGSDRIVTVYRAEEGNSWFVQTALSQSFQAAIKFGRPFIVDDIPPQLSSPTYRWGNLNKPVKSLAGAPIMIDDKVTGLIVVQSYQRAAYTVDDTDLLAEIGKSIARPLERTHLIDRLNTHSRREAALRNLTGKLSATFDAQMVLQSTTHGFADIFDDALILATAHDASRGPNRHFISINGPQDLRDVLGITADDTLMLGGLASTAIEADEARSEVIDGVAIATIPLLDGEEAIGSILIARRSPVTFSEDAWSVFDILSGIVVGALRNAFMYRHRSRNDDDLMEVSRISRLVASSLDPDAVVREIIATMPELFQSEGCSIRIIEGDMLVPLAEYGEIVQSFSERIPIATSLAGTIVRDKHLLAVHDLHHHPATGYHARKNGIKVRGWMAAPMLDDNNEVIGILSVHSDYPRRWTERDQALLQTVVKSTAIAIQNAWRFSRTRDTLMASVESLANAVDAKDPTTLYHSRGVATYARILAEALELPPEEVEMVALAGLLHDVGKIGIPDRILQKPDVLDDNEWEQMKTHPVIGEQILAGNVHLQPVLPIVRHHHERWDGHGYPDELAGTDIPVGATIVALADAIDTMASNRPYRKALSWAHITSVIQAESGKQFNPDVVNAFLKLVERGTLPTRITTNAEKPARPGVQPQGLSLDARALMIFHGVAREIRALTDLDTFISNITGVIASVMEVSDVRVYLADEQSGDIVFLPAGKEPKGRLTGSASSITQGVLEWVVEHRQPLVIADTRSDARSRMAFRAGVRSILAVPLVVEDQAIGALNVKSERVSAFGESDVRLLTATAAQIAQTVEVARLHNRFKQLASTDALTGLANHRAFYDRLEEEIRHASVTGSPLTLVVMDLDNFKMVNDTHGHLAGDAVLREIARQLRILLRKSDFIARYGGDEFAFIMADTDQTDASAAFSSLVSTLSTVRINVDGTMLRLSTGAWGMASYPEDGVRPAELVRVADQRMYSRKQLSHLERGSAPSLNLVAGSDG